jgi:Transcription antiterminator
LRRISSRKNGKRKVVERIKFPGYVFVKMIESPVNCYNVLRTRGITSFTGPKGAPIPIFPEEVKRLGLEKIDIVDIDVKVGDNIRVISGALESFIGVVDDISLERQKVQVIVSMFGRQIHVELDIAQIEKI